MKARDLLEADEPEAEENPRALLRQAMAATRQVTGGARKWPMVDRHDRRLHVGDRIRYQYCSGRYGQVRQGEITVDKAHYPYGDIGYASFHYDRKANVLRGHHRHDDFEHAHETWVEIIS